MTRWIVAFVVALVVVLGVGALVHHSTVDAGTPSSSVVVVESNLVIGPGQHVFSAPIALDGFARWAFQITVRNGFPLNFDWRPVYRFRSDFDWAANDPAFTIDTFQTLEAPAPEAAIEFRNAGSGTIRVAISASMYRHRIDGAYRGTGSGQVLVGPSTVSIAPGQTQFSDAFDIGDGDLVSYQLQLDSGPPASGQVLSDVQWRIFNPQDFELDGTVSATSNHGVSGLLEAKTPHTRLRLRNNTGDFVQARVAVYVLHVQ